MWLLDANMDVHLVAVLGACSIRCDTGRQPWMESAVERRTRCSGSERRLHLFADARRALWRVGGNGTQREQFIAAWAQRAIEPVAGSMTRWP